MNNTPSRNEKGLVMLEKMLQTVEDEILKKQERREQLRTMMSENHAQLMELQSDRGVLKRTIKILEPNDEVLSPSGGQKIVKVVNGKRCTYIKKPTGLALHSFDDEPAVLWPRGKKEWWKNGKRHRSGNKPAIVYPEGTQCWWKNGKKHRDGDLPAVVWSSGKKEWWVDGVRLGDQPPLPIEEDVFDKLLKLLDDHDVEYHVIQNDVSIPIRQNSHSNE